jgi:hypothetical protein
VDAEVYELSSVDQSKIDQYANGRDGTLVRTGLDAVTQVNDVPRESKPSRRRR